MSIQRKLDEAYKHIKPYISETETPILLRMCRRCERWNGDCHDYEECRTEPCFVSFLAYSYLKWAEAEE